MALDRLAAVNPSRWMVTAVQGLNEVFPSTSHDKPLDALLSLHIWRHCGVYAASRPFPVTDLAVAALASMGFFRPLPTDLRSCHRRFLHLLLTIYKLSQFPRPASLQFSLRSKLD